MIVLEALWGHHMLKVPRLGSNPQASDQKSQCTISIKFMLVSGLHWSNFEHVVQCKMDLIRLHSREIFLFTGGT